MSWYDKIHDNLQDIATKAGLTPEKLKSVTDTLNKELAKIPDHAKALQATAEQHGIEVGKIRESLAHAGAQLSDAADSVAGQVFHTKP
jgi:hypothetical protein